MQMTKSERETSDSNENHLFVETNLNVFSAQSRSMFCGVGATTEGTLELGRPDIAKHKHNFRKKDVREFPFFGTASHFSENLMLFGGQNDQNSHFSPGSKVNHAFKAKKVAFRERNCKNAEKSCFFYS